ncbi:MAG: hypothetical protein D6805_04600 [Planctomycetota bacterium]|nr:MAG: hypothetical protein D6805_04600 [Planctomycetota bacterium]
MKTSILQISLLLLSLMSLAHGQVVDFWKADDDKDNKKEVVEKKDTSIPNPTTETKSRSKPKKSKAEIEAEISRNESKTIRIYNKILDSERYEIKNLKRRVNVNQRLIGQYQSRLEKAQKDLKRINIEYIRQGLALKRALDEKKLTKPQFDKAMRRLKEKFHVESSELKADIQFYKQEISKAQSRYQYLKTSLEVKEKERKFAKKLVEGKKKFTNPDFDKIYKKFKSLLPKRLRPVFINNPLKSKFLLRTPKTK